MAKMTIPIGKIEENYVISCDKAFYFNWYPKNT